MKCSIFLPLLLFVFFMDGCGGKKPDFKRSEIISTSQTFGIGNLTVVEVDPNGRKVSIEWIGYNQLHSGALAVPEEHLTLTSGNEVYVATDRNAGNDSLYINGNLYRFDSETHHLWIRFGKGVTIVKGGNYRDARKIYDENPTH